MNKGFSLIELLVTIAILAIMLSVALPNLSYWMAKNKTKNFAYRLASEINYSREISRKNGKRVVVALIKAKVNNQNWTGKADIDPVCCLIFEDVNKNCKFDNGDKIVFYDKCTSVEITKNQLSRAFENSGKCAVFFPVGLPLIGATPEEIEIQSKTYSKIKYTVTLTPVTGIASVE